jgi:hypothetical protein
MFSTKVISQWVFRVICVLILLTTVYTQQVQAARGKPGSSEFGFGASIYLNGPFLNEAVYLATSLELDWISIDIPWEDYMPQADSQIQFSLLDQVMQTARDHKVNVLARLTSPPAWALTPYGPDASAAGHFVSALCNRYGTTMQAIEIFPGANTRAGWGAAPNLLTPPCWWQVV